ncbi:hypothetical protein Vretimale_18662 [Volvox reticuliferus]|uniref:Uncharacterized protein n=1 Tax=Volvox reticuliferus TaxID=1737510 RepID=A0A8J4CT62_9CHLO|nr:hypothetical protein Vretifemale_17166 [Volvox reticuliferus]GIM15992.1 hypothetical protein Vretimale_18662 [Volvox reticuliferus]
MLRALHLTARRQEALRYPCQVLHIVSSPPGETFGNQSVSGTYDLTFEEPHIITDQATSGVVPELGRQRPAPTSLYECSASPSRWAFPQPDMAGCKQRGTVIPPMIASATEATCQQPLNLLTTTSSTRAARTDRRECFHHCFHHQQIRQASSSSAASAKSKARGGSGKAAASPVPPRLRTPEWARMPLQLDSLPEVMRRRTARLLTLHERLKAEASKAEAGGWAAANKLATVEAAAQALPIPPKDSGEAGLGEAMAPGASFEAAYGTMKELCRRGVCLSAEPHLVSLLRKASTTGHLSSALELLRTNHLVQAAARLGAHAAGHNGLHDVLVQECQRLRTAAPLVELWGSLYEHGMEPSREAGTAAVQAAVSLRDGSAAMALLSLTSQYSKEPLAAGAEVPAVLELVQSESPEAAAKLRQLLPRLGFVSAA